MNVLAHGIGSRQDLPIPFSFALAGAVLALVVSFGVLALAWPRSRLRGPSAGRPLPGAVQVAVDAPLTRLLLRLAGLAAAAYVALAAYFGPADGRNPTAGVVYVLVWVGVPLASVLLGPVWRAPGPLPAGRAAA